MGAAAAIQSSRRDLDAAPFERALVERFQAGEETAFTKLYLAYFDDIYAYLRVALADAHEAEDAAQEVFLGVYRALHRYDARREIGLRNWLFTIARNQAITMLRRRVRAEPADPSSLDLGASEAPGSSVRFDDAHLFAAVERLPAARRQVIALRYVLGLTTREIATVLDRSPRAVRQLHHRALRSLEERLSPRCV